MALGDVIARLSVSLGLETAAFEKGSRKAQQEVNTLSNQMTKAAKAIGGALTGMVAWEAVQMLRDWTRAAVDSAGALGEQAAALGVTTDALQEYRYAATQVGLESAEMDKAFEQLTRRMGDAAIAGKGPIVEAFKALGITLDELRGKTAGDVIPMIADGMAKIEDPARRASIAVDLFGKSGQKLATLLSGGATEVNKLREAAHELGIVLSESDIAKADEVADKLAALNYVIEAQKNKKLLENAEAMLEFEQALGDLKLQLIDFSGEADKWNTTLNTFEGEWQTFWRDLGRDAGIHAFFDTLANLSFGFEDLKRRAFAAIGDMVGELGRWIGGTLSRIFDNAMSKIRATGAMFEWLYDVVVGNSYVPDMVDEIGAHMARLDTLMVGQAGKATSATAKKFQDLRDLLDDLFPEIGKANQFNADLAAIEGSGLSQAAQDAAVERLWRRTVSGSPFGGGGMGGPDFGDAGPLVEGMGNTEDAIQRLTDKAKIGTVQIAKSFADMATDTLDSLGKLTSAIKGGGFFDILQSVVGFGLQLGQAGAFGPGAAKFLNAPPSSIKAFASGTNFAPGGLSLVGERGPELVNLPRGSKVIPNGKFGGNTYHIQGNLLTPEFWAQIQAGDMAAMHGGAAGGVAQMNYRQSRRVG